jgi:hypothetical protein
MRLPIEKAGFAPEADLRTVMVRRLDHPGQLHDAERALARSPVTEGPFFTKGLATTEGFRPSYWSYGKAHDIAARDAGAAIELRSAEVARGAAPTDEAQASGGPMGRTPHDASPEDGEVSGLERAFLEAHRQALMQEPEPGSESDGTSQAESPSSAAGNPDVRAPAADLRTVPVRPSGRDAARIDGLFLRKSHAAADDASARLTEPTGDIAAAAERGSEEPRALPAGYDLTLEIATPTGEPLPVAEAPQFGLDDMPVAEEPERPNDAIRDATSKSASTGRGSLLAPIQEAIIVFGCVALLASLGVFNPSTAPPPRPVAAEVQPQTQAAAPEAHPLAAAVPDLLTRGDERLRSGDVVGARLFYEKAADTGNAHGALMMGATFDPKFLASIGVYGLRGDEQAAMAWYRRAGELGDPGAAKLGNPAHK